MIDWSAITTRLQGCLPTGAVAAADGLPLDDVPARVVCTPADAAQLCEVVRMAAAERCPIYPLGGRTLLSLGLAGTDEGIGVSTLGLDRVIDYPARDMTITVGAGIRLAKLQQILAAEGQRLPVDVPRPAEATLGGAIATNTSGPRRNGFGTFRDYVIGVSVVDAHGKETKAGGRVVKNVAGYDLCKLYTGSLGTLGIITQVTLKLRPQAEAAAVVWIKFDAIEQVAVALDRLATSRTRPIAVEVLNSLAAEHVAAEWGESLPCRPWVVALGFEENTDAVRWQCAQVRSELGGLDVWCETVEADRARGDVQGELSRLVYDGVHGQRSASARDVVGGGERRQRHRLWPRRAARRSRTSARQPETPLEPSRFTARQPGCPSLPRGVEGNRSGLGASARRRFFGGRTTRRPVADAIDQG
jgi:FAD/FMN-containing dehydrogenase